VADLNFVSHSIMRIKSLADDIERDNGDNLRVHTSEALKEISDNLEKIVEAVQDLQNNCNGGM